MVDSRIRFQLVRDAIDDDDGTWEDDEHNQVLCRVAIPTDCACVAAYDEDGRPCIEQEPEPCVDRARIIVNATTEYGDESLLMLLQSLDYERLCDMFRLSALRELRRTRSQAHRSYGDRKTALHVKSWIDHVLIQVMV